jgi:lipoprotein-releasing system ATP-binding protein
MDLLELRGVSKQYEGADDTVLNNIDFELEAGKTVAVVGPSGSGKSTLLNIIGTLDRPTKGTVTLEGNDVFSLNETDLAALRNQRIGFVFQLHHLLPQCTILENVLVPALPHAERDAAESRGRQLLERVGLSHRLDHRPGQLSGGERQRVAVVRALINRPALLLADEPTGSLDRATSESIVELLLELNREEAVALITVTHSSKIAERMDRVLELRDGKVKPHEFSRMLDRKAEKGLTRSR